MVYSNFKLNREKLDLHARVIELESMLRECKYDKSVETARYQESTLKWIRRAIIAEAKLSIYQLLGPAHGGKVCDEVYEKIYSAIDDAKKADA